MWIAPADAGPGADADAIPSEAMGIMRVTSPTRRITELEEKVDYLEEEITRLTDLVEQQQDAFEELKEYLGIIPQRLALYGGSRNNYVRLLEPGESHRAAATCSGDKDDAALEHGDSDEESHVSAILEGSVGDSKDYLKHS